jgi:hypothetical protein
VAPPDTGGELRHALADKRLYEFCELMCASRTTPASGPRSWPDRSSDHQNYIGTKRLVNRETSTIIVGTGSCARGKGYVFLPNRSLGMTKSSSASISRMSGSAIGFEMTARRESGLGVASSSSGLRMIRSSGSALR